MTSRHARYLAGARKKAAYSCGKVPTREQVAKEGKALLAEFNRVYDKITNKGGSTRDNPVLQKVQKKMRDFERKYSVTLTEGFGLDSVGTPDEWDLSASTKISLSSPGQNLLAKLERFAGTSIKPGRNTIKGFPVDIEDQSPDEGGMVLDAVDRDAATGLLKALRAAGFKATRQGQLGISIAMSASTSSAPKPTWLKSSDLARLKANRHVKAVEFIGSPRGSYIAVTLPDRSTAFIEDLDDLNAFFKDPDIMASIAAFACGPSSATFKFENAGKARAFKQALKSLIDKGVEVNWDGNSTVKVKGRHEGDLREARAAARKLGAIGLSMSSPQMKPLAFSFNDDVDRELFVAEVEFATRKSPRKIETWNASCAVPIKSAQEAGYIKRVAQKYQAVAASWSCGPSMTPAPTAPAAPAQEDAPTACDMSLSFQTPQAAQAFAAGVMRLSGSKVSVDGNEVKCTLGYDIAPKALGFAMSAMRPRQAMSASSGAKTSGGFQAISSPLRSKLSQYVSDGEIKSLIMDVQVGEQKPLAGAQSLLRGTGGESLVSDLAKALEYYVRAK